jgi:hypothetical protein
MYSSVHLERLTRQEALAVFPADLGAAKAPHRSFLFLVDQRATELDRMIAAVTARRLMHHGHVYIADIEQSCIEEWDGIIYMPLYCGTVPRVGVVTTVAVFHDSGLALMAAKAYPKAEIFVIHHDIVCAECGDVPCARDALIKSHLW